MKNTTDVHIKLGVSTCLLGERVRYDGGHKLDRYVRDVDGKFTARQLLAKRP